MKKLHITIGFILAILFVPGVALSEPNTLYFMSYLPYQSYMNPAFQSKCGGYVELPILSTINLSLGNNSLSLNDIVFAKDGQMVTALNPDYGDRDVLYSTIKSTTKISEEVSVSLFGLGMKIKKKGYLTINASLKQNASLYLPKDLFKLALYGTPDTVNVNKYNLQSLGVSASSYIDFSTGYSHKINEQWTVGGRVKLLVGIANASASFSDLELQASQDEWRIVGKGKAMASIPGLDVAINSDGSIDSLSMGDDVLSSFKPNFGAGFDAGVIYKPIKNLSLSLAVRDIGFISWKNSVTVANGNINYSFQGVEYDTNDGDISYGDSIKNVLEDSYTVDATKDSYTTWLNAKFYLGAEYAFWKDRMSLGLLSKTTLENEQLYEEITTSLNVRPCRWISTSVSYSLLSGGFSNIGVGFNLRLSPFNFYMVGDYIPLYYSSEGIPYKTETVNLQTGIVLTFGCKAKKKKVKEEIILPAPADSVAKDTVQIVPIDTAQVDTSAVVQVDSVQVQSVQPIEIKATTSDTEEDFQNLLLLVPQGEATVRDSSVVNTQVLDEVKTQDPGVLQEVKEKIEDTPKSAETETKELPNNATVPLKETIENKK